MINEFLIRMGTLFTLAGIGLFILFGASTMNNTPDFLYFFLGLISIFIGWRFLKRKAPPPPSERFATLRKLWGNSKKKEEGKKE